VISLADSSLRIKNRTSGCCFITGESSQTIYFQPTWPLPRLDPFIRGFFFDGNKYRSIPVRSNNRIPVALRRHGLEGQVTNCWTPCNSMTAVRTTLTVPREC
jgi:hypothetical protein